MAGNTFLEFYKTTLDYRTKVISIIFASGIAIAIPNLVTYLKDRGVAQLEGEKALNDKERVGKELELKKVELEIARTHQYQDFTSRFLSFGANQDIELRLRFAEYWAFVADEADRPRWKSYYEELKRLRDSLRDDLDRLRDDYAKELGKEAPDPIRIALLERHIRWTEAGLSPVATNESVTIAKSRSDEIAADLTFFEAGMKITVDGWPDGGKLDPYWGMTTALKQPGTGASLDASVIPYVVLPSGKTKSFGIELGDLFAVYNRANDKLAFAVFADFGPASKLGEGSIALARDLGISTDHLEGTRSGIVYVGFANSAKRDTPITHDSVVTEGKRLFEKWGGLAEVKRRLSIASK